MRTIDELQAEIDEARAAIEGDDSLDELDASWAQGMLDGFEQGRQLVRDGKTSAEIAAWAAAQDAAYVSVGNDRADVWQSGYTAALDWVGEQFDWQGGNPVYREGNRFGMPAGARGD